MKGLDDLDVDGKRVLVRVDFNVPLDGERITDDTRIRAALPTIEALRERGARLLLAAHLGRPKDREPEFSLAPVAERLGELLDTEVELAPDLDHVPDGELVMLENIRYEPGETKNDPELAKRLAALADAYVDDAFGAAHRAHASTEGVARLLPHAAGLLLEREVQTLTGILEDPARPLVAILSVTLAPPTTATSGRRGSSRMPRSVDTSRSSSRPAALGSRCATASVEACARWAEPKASFTYASASAA